MYVSAARVEECHTPWAHCPDGPRRTPSPAPVDAAGRRTGGSGHRGRGPGAVAWGRGGTPALRPRPGRRAAGLARGCRLRRRRGARRARATAVPRASPAARLPRRVARRRRPERRARRRRAWCTRCCDSSSPSARSATRWRTRSTHCAPRAEVSWRTTSRRSRTAARSALADTLAAHARNLSGLVPRFAPGWMPRTDDRVAIPLGGGRVILHGTFDLVVGLPRPRTASLCALGAVHGRALGIGAAVAALSLPARDPPQRHSPVPAGPAGVGERPLRRGGRA